MNIFILSAGRKIERKKMTFEIKFGAIEEADTYLHVTSFRISPLAVCSSKIKLK